MAAIPDLGLAVRAVTHFVALSRDSSTWRKSVLAAAHACAAAAERFGAAGYATQTLRVVTNPFGEFLDLTSDATAVAGMEALRDILTCDEMPKGIRVRFALGEARTVQEVRVVPALIRSAADLANCCVNVACDAMGVPDAAMTRAAAECCAALATTTARGEGNFNFTANFNMAPGCPYFPAAYNGSGCEPGFSIGLEYPGLMVQTLAALADDAPYDVRVASLRAAVAPHVLALHELCVAHAASSGFKLLGFDTSAAPSKDTASMADVCRGMGLQHFGAAGTVQCAALLTRFFKSFADGGDDCPAVPLVGFSGLMLACLEDTGLAAAAAAQQYTLNDLMTYSAVCGIGLDTVPIPGDTPVDKIAALMADCGTMAFRLRKPLTVRLFPCPGLAAGQMTTFTSDDLCNCTVFAVP